MEYVVFDLEFNQHYGRIKDKTEQPKIPFEVIQIGAVKLDSSLQQISTFNHFVKPQIYPELHPLIKDMTGITIDTLKRGKSFKEVFEDFMNFTSSEETIFCIWGAADIKELFRNATYYGLDTSLIPQKYINLQNYMSKYLNCPNGTCIGLKNTVELLNIPLECEFHNAFNDSLYTAEIFKRIYNEPISYKIYNPANPNSATRRRTSSKVLDSTALINQFQKMFNREMTEDEQTIIKLAYMMGKTNQFQVETTKK